ncbi:MAG: carboxypeptidase-like regulatory domain-containing protein [Saprospiraceae bacterium]
MNLRYAEIFVHLQLMHHKILPFLIALGCTFSLAAQGYELVQLSGMVYSREGQKIKVLPFAEVSINNGFRVVFGNELGFYSIAASRGDTIRINYLIYKESVFIIPKDVESDHLTLNQQLERDTIFLPKVTVNPWPDREHFRPEFLAIDVEESMRKIAEANLIQSRIRELMKITPPDGRESVSLYLNQQAQRYYYQGQIPPQRIFSPIAWIEFFKAWKRGDFKKKK